MQSLSTNESKKNEQEVLEMELRQAVTQVADRESLDYFKSILKKINNINAKSPSTDKTVFNFAVESLFRLILNTSELNASVIAFKLTAIDLLLIQEVDIYVLRHPETKSIVDLMTTKNASIIKKINVNSIDCKAPFSCLDKTEQILIAAYHWYTKSLKTSIKATILKIESTEIVLRHKPKAKPIIICDNNFDQGSYLLLAALEKRLFSIGYNTLGLGYEYNVDLARVLELFEKAKIGDGIFGYNNHVKTKHDILKLALEKNFNLIKLDASGNWHDTELKMLLEMHTISILAKKISIAVRDQGMFYATLNAIYKAEGKIIVIVGAEHVANLTGNLQQQGIDSIVVAPFVDNKALELKFDESGNFVCESRHDRLRKLFEVYGCKPLDLSNQEKSLEIIDNFWRGCFPAAASNRLVL